ncbi:putative sodium:amino acid symporter [Methanocella paludicola SANAE]|uniref:Sodium:amino acid symporter n=1 Tax=Methanocella paludicola (strain DSM 17711 / JCM 13418 / NBRC 101707 / SANAE) TaxID=304371 RepID=D1YWI7_METPS|nr:sodium:alanine symporter family protein [Methanocella paludicola]BAI60809.1 putative sodium:amino acid symporter [Methanocella paludicola SANAE]
MGLLEIFQSVISTVNGFVWGIPMLVLLVGTGLLLTIRLKGIQFRELPLAFSRVMHSIKTRKSGDQEGDIPAFHALCTALSATVGTGNIAGVATAIVMGGPGALFWMWMTALVGMVTKYSEAVLSVKYRQKNPDGSMSGGPMYYIEKGLKMKWLAVLFALCGTVAAFGIGSMTQANSVTLAITSQLDVGGSIVLPVFGEISVLSLVIGAILVAITALVTFGGIKRIGEVASILVPFMAISYIIGGLLVLAINYARIPDALVMVFNYAFTPYAAVGGVAGYAVAQAVRYGMARGVFSNEAGLGSAPIAYAAAKTNSPVNQGLIAITEVFLDTLVICSITGLVVLTSGLWDDGVYNSTSLTIAAFTNSLGLPGLIMVVISAVLFGYSTILGWAYYGEQCFHYLFGNRMKNLYKVLFLCAVLFGSVTKVSLVWDISDTFNGMMAIPNLVALVALSGVVVAETKQYFDERKANRGQEGPAAVVQ